MSRHASLLSRLLTRTTFTRPLPTIESFMSSKSVLPRVIGLIEVVSQLHDQRRKISPTPHAWLPHHSSRTMLSYPTYELNLHHGRRAAAQHTLALMPQYHARRKPTYLVPHRSGFRTDARLTVPKASSTWVTCTAIACQRPPPVHKCNATCTISVMVLVPK